MCGITVGLGHQGAHFATDNYGEILQGIATANEVIEHIEKMQGVKKKKAISKREIGSLGLVSQVEFDHALQFVLDVVKRGVDAEISLIHQYTCELEQVVIDAARHDASVGNINQMVVSFTGDPSYR